MSECEKRHLVRHSPRPPGSGVMRYRRVVATARQEVRIQEAARDAIARAVLARYVYSVRRER